MKTIKQGRIGKNTVRLLSQRDEFIGIAFNEAGKEIGRQAGPDGDIVWAAIHGDVARSSPSYFGFQGAVARFQRLFTDGFASADFEESERGYKVAAKEKLESEIPLERVKNVMGLGAKALGVFSATNLVSPFEKMRVKDALRGVDGDRIVRTMAEFARGEMSALKELDRLLRPHDAAKWTIITYLPFLWAPDSNMFLKPEVTKDFASRVGHNFSERYASALEPAVYASLLDLTNTTSREIAALKPRDNIDIQSFVWVIGEYAEPNKYDASN